MSRRHLEQHRTDRIGWLGISDLTAARPVQAVCASAATFAVGAALPLATALISPARTLIPVVVVSSIFSWQSWADLVPGPVVLQY